MNKERRNDLAKRAYHRVVARALKISPGLLDEARALVRGWMQEAEPPRFVEEWHTLLARSASEVRREITRRSKAADRLRIDSPFFLTPTRIVSDDQRRELGRIASRLVSAH
jgi:hypothetical protein